MGELLVVGVDGSRPATPRCGGHWRTPGAPAQTMPGRTAGCDMAAHPLPAATCLVHRAAYAWAAAGAAGSE